jgi:hypothetical protein
MDRACAPVSAEGQRARVTRNPGLTTHHKDANYLGINVQHPALAGQRDTVVAVTDEVPTINFVHADRRDLSVGERPSKSVNPLALRGIARSKAAIEVARAIHTADDIDERNCAEADVVLASQVHGVQLVGE